MPGAEIIDFRFRRRRARNWILLGVLYALFYMSRYNFSVAHGALEKLLGLTPKDMGVFETVMPLVYGASVFLNGPLADRIGGRKAFLFGTVGAALMNFVFGLIIAHAHPGDGSSLLTWLVVVWAVNGFFQSFGALSIVKVNAQWFHLTERGTFAGVFGVLIRMGLILAFFGTPFILEHLSLPWAFWVPAIGLSVFFVLNLLFMQNTPKDAGLPALDTGDGDPNDDEPAKLGYVLKKVFLSRAAVTVAFASMMIGCIRRSTIDAWWPDYMSQMYHPHALAGFGPYELATWGIAFAGIAGGFAFGIVSDHRYGGRRGPVIAVGFGSMAVLLGLFAVGRHVHLGAYASAWLLVALSFFINGAHGMIGGAASMDFGGRKGAATAAGFFDGIQYIAASPMGAFMGWLVSKHAGWNGWDYWPLVLIPFALVGLALGASLWNALPKQNKRSPHG
jgi:OPA family glycerol-3-phosphate transporter-like MFS transporter